VVAGNVIDPAACYGENHFPAIISELAMKTAGDVTVMMLSLV